MKENEKLFLVPIDLMQKTLNLLQSLPYSQVSGIINEFLELKAVEVKIEEEKETSASN
jgi:hypothetical protein